MVTSIEKLKSSILAHQKLLRAGNLCVVRPSSKKTMEGKRFVGKMSRYMFSKKEITSELISHMRAAYKGIS